MFVRTPGHRIHRSLVTKPYTRLFYNSLQLTFFGIFLIHVTKKNSLVDLNMPQVNARSSSRM